MLANRMFLACGLMISTHWTSRCASLFECVELTFISFASDSLTYVIRPPPLLFTLFLSCLGVVYPGISTN